MTGVFLVDDHRSFTDLLALGLGVQPGLDVVGVAHSADDARAALGGADDARAVLGRVAPDVVVLDVRLPGGGLTLLPDVRAAGARALVLTAHPRPGPARRARDLGAAGFLGKDTPLPGIVAAIRTVAAGGSAHGTPAEVPHLTPREQEVLDGLARGRDVTALATVLGLSGHTVRDHVRALLGKLGARSQLEAVVAAERVGLVAFDPEGEPAADAR
ncbi:response regulator transcription factor [Pseudonocardia nematodicida]|uniref:Response regulator transcription factor n=1 Tax=Pseudonocardia nematodicida TaxID=1206997 RepID=A0ABV1K6L4_9PSEU